MADEPHIKALMTTRRNLIMERRNIATKMEVSTQSARNMAEAMITIQTAIDAVDKAIEDEKANHNSYTLSNL